MPAFSKIKAWVADTFFPRKNSGVYYACKTDPEAGRSWFQLPRSRKGDVWHVAPKGITYVRGDGEWLAILSDEL